MVRRFNDEIERDLSLNIDRNNWGAPLLTLFEKWLAELLAL
jgi:hypothetical protein